MVSTASADVIVLFSRTVTTISNILTDALTISFHGSLHRSLRHTFLFVYTSSAQTRFFSQFFWHLLLSTIFFFLATAEPNAVLHLSALYQFQQQSLMDRSRFWVLFFTSVSPHPSFCFALRSLRFHHIHACSSVLHNKLFFHLFLSFLICDLDNLISPYSHSFPSRLTLFLFPHSLGLHIAFLINAFPPHYLVHAMFCFETIATKCFLLFYSFNSNVHVSFLSHFCQCAFVFFP